MKNTRKFLTVALAIGGLAVSSGLVFAGAQAPVPSSVQPDPISIVDTPVKITDPLSPEVLILKHIEKELKEKYKKELYIPPSIQSLFISPAQQSLLREARGGFNTQTPTETPELASLPDGLDRDGPSLDSPGVSVRSLSLGGIVFITPDDWTIWLNKKRITSNKIPREAIDLRVYKDFIELRWFDAQSNQIFPIRLRPNQTFNLDVKTFVPG